MDLALRATIFPQAEAEIRYQPSIPPPERFTRPDTTEMTPEEREAWSEWLADQRKQREEMANIDHVAAQRARTASSGIALILIGLPLYLYHWRLIKREVMLRREPDA